MKYLFAFLLLIPSLAFGQPSTGYASATPDAPNNDGESGFSFIVDIANLPASWKSACEDVDATRGRVYRNDGTTRLAVDWINYDYNGGSPTGLIRFQDAAALSPTTYRIYPPVSGNATVAASDTYGSDNAYASHWKGYWPEGGGTDRTSTGNDGTAQGGVTVGGVAGKIGTATNFDGSNDYITLADPPLTTSATVLVWATAEAGVNGFEHVMSWFPGFIIGRTSTGPAMRAYVDAGGGSEASFGIAPSASQTHYTLRYDGSNVYAILNGTTANSTARTGTMSSAGDLTIGTYYADPTNATYIWDGTIGEVQIHSSALTNEWIAYEYAQSNDNSAFWNTWSWTAGGSSTVPLIHYYQQNQGD